MYYNSTTSNPSAWIVDSKDRGRKKIYLNSKIYLDNNQEFLIELFNPTKDSVLAEIKVNGNNASGNGLILRPGERFYLDCFVGDKRKFIFKTYEVENSNESLNAIANNGFVEVSFFKEKVSSKYNTYIGQLGSTTNTYVDLKTANRSYTSPIVTISNTSNGTYGTYNSLSSVTNVNLNNTGTSNLNAYYTSNTSDNTIHYSDYLAENLDKTTAYMDYLAENLEKSINYSEYVCENVDQKIDYSEYVSKNMDNSSKTLNVSTTETGRIEKGDKSQQKFEAVNMDFETYCINKVSYQLLPNSKKPIETAELKKNFCSNCGHKLKGTEKFCPSCGTRI
jgi:rRNA maturation endonuclease Nob1